LAASAINVLDDDPELSVLLALEAAQGVDPAFESVSALHEAMQNHRTVRTIEWPADWNWQGFLDGSISPDGSLVAVSGFLNRMAVWDLDAASDEPLWTFEVPYPDYAVILPVFNIDGSHVIATVAWSSWAEPPEDWPEPPSEVGVYVLDSRTGEVISHYRGPDCPIVRLYQSGRYIDEHRLVAASAPAEGECTAIDTPMSDVWLLDLQTGQMTLAYEDPGDAVGWPTDLSLSEDSKYLSFIEEPMLSEDSKYLSFIEEPMSRVVDLETGLEVFAAPGGIYSVLNRDGTRLLTANESTITLWDIATATELQGYSAEARLTSPSFNPDETLVYATGYDGAVRVWDTATGELLHELKGHDQFTLYPSMTSDSARLASFSGDRTVRIWDVTASGEGEVNGFDFPGRMVVQSGRVVGDRAAVLLYQDPLDWAEPATALVFDPSTGETIRTFEGYGGQMY
jgi:WD40 repeat protein